jgi:hypothetical protein
MDWKRQALIEITRMKAELDKSHAINCDQLAVNLISQEISPVIMASNLKYWLDLYFKPSRCG